MRGLLIKIFLWFWLALAFIAVSIVLTILTIEEFIALLENRQATG